MHTPFSFPVVAFLAISLFFGACSVPDSTVKKTTIAGQEILGLASPIKLRLDSTLVPLSDYFHRSVEVKQVTWDGGEVFFTGDASGLILIGSGSKPLSVLHLTTSKGDYDIPVFANEKIAYSFVLDTFLSADALSLAGNFNGWNPSATPLQKTDEGWSANLLLPPGEYAYQLVVDGAWQLDPTQTNKKSNGQGGFNSIFTLGNAFAVPFVSSLSTEQGRLKLHSSSPEIELRAFWNNQLLPVEELGIDLNNLVAEGRTHLRVFGYQGDQRSNDLLIPLDGNDAVEKSASLSRKDWQSMIMYFALVDRFVDGNPSNNRPVDDKDVLPIANHFGGDLSGISQKIVDGYFDDLGVNTIWISPIIQNPEGAWGLWDKGVTSKFSGYHGYWPISSSRVDDRLGSAQSLTSMIDKAHESEMNVLLDYVANHVHEEHPIYQQNKDWATPLYLPDGRMNTELWDEQRLTTWFDTFLPTLDLSKPEVASAMSDSALFWLENFQLDGFRHDATKHIPEAFWRSLTHKIKNRVEQEGRDIYQIGETYGNPELISSYMGSGMIDSQFDFNLYDAMVDAFAKPESGFGNLKRVLEESLHHYGSHHLMGNITGNQDRTRFISYADGSVGFGEDAKLAGWIRSINHKSTQGFDRFRELYAFLMTAPGVPTIYYGDEIGMPGANDPDNRRMMHFGDWNEKEQALYDWVKTLTAIRKERMSLMYGETFVHLADKDAIVMVRSYLGEYTITTINKTSGQLEIDIPLVNLDGKKVDLNLGATAELQVDRIAISADPGGSLVGIR